MHQARHRRRDLAQACRDAFHASSLSALGLAELAICATDLAEIGTAIGLNLLFGIPLEIGVADRARRVSHPVDAAGFRYVEAGGDAVLVIAVCFAFGIAMADPNWGEGIRGFAPTVEIVKNPEMLYWRSASSAPR